MAREQHAAFADRVDVSGFARLAVFDGGRVKIVDTLAREQLARIYGRSRWRDDVTGHRYHPVFTYLDLLFNKAHYFDKPIVHVEVLPLRRRMVAHLPEDERERWLRLGRLSPELIAEPAVQDILAGRGADLRLFQAQQLVTGAWNALVTAGARLNMVSPDPGTHRWHHLLTVYADPDSVGDAEAGRRVAEQLEAARVAWQAGDADAVNAALAGLVEQLPGVNAETYPASFPLTVEAIYNATSRFTIGFYVYLLAAVALMIAFAVGRRWLAMTGLGLLLLVF
ncbi:MAG: hypothetical protein WD118_05210, partial [Phycisphaeraceae bacterium]